MATSFQILPDTAVPTAGDPLAVTIRVLGAEAEIAESFRGTAHLDALVSQAQALVDAAVSDRT